MRNKLVSVIVPTKNSAQTLEDCLKSIGNQTYKYVELIIIDNFSTDDTPEIAKRYTKYFYSHGPERSAQRNFGVSKAKGEYIAIIDSDMNMEPSVVEECVEAINSPGVVGVVIPEESFGQGFWAQCKRLERSFYVNVPYMEAARFFHKAIFEKVGGYDVSMVSGEDWDLSQRIQNMGRLSRAESYIYHDEGRLSLLKTLRKKYYYSQKFANYKKKNESQLAVQEQTSLLNRYWLFLSQPGKLFHNPLLGIGMLFMKTCEFGLGGIGYLVAKFKGQPL